MCPVCGKGLRSEHVDHIVKCLQEARDQARAAENACAQVRSDPVVPHAIMIPIPIISSPMQVVAPCQQPAAREAPCQMPMVRVAPCEQPQPAARSSCDMVADTRPSADSTSWVKDWIDQISRALTDSQQSTGCATCGADPCCCCRGGRSIKPEDLKDLPEDLQEDLPEEMLNGGDVEEVEVDAVEKADKRAAGDGEGDEKASS